MAAQLPDLAEVPILGSFGAQRLMRSSKLHFLRTNLEIILPASFLVLITLACFVWPLVYPVPPPNAVNGLLSANLMPLSHGHIFGTDVEGNDIFSRILYGGRVSLEVGLGSTAIGMIIGGFLGSIAGLKGGFAEAVIMRILDMLLAFPALVLAITIATYLGPSELHVIWAISFFSIPAFARLSRAHTLRMREQVFVVSGKLNGERDSVILARHLVPNILPNLLTFAFLGVGITIVIEASLSFLGLGVPPPQPSWGNMIADGQSYLGTNPYLVLIPSAFLFATVIALNLLSDALRVRWAEI
jgi:peptide/nickel transport system permease protein